MILSIDRQRYVGKTIKEITIEPQMGEDITMCEAVRILFTDGDSLKLEPDVRGSETYISQQVDQ